MIFCHLPIHMTHIVSSTGCEHQNLLDIRTNTKTKIPAAKIPTPLDSQMSKLLEKTSNLLVYANYYWTYNYYRISLIAPAVILENGRHSQTQCSLDWRDTYFCSSCHGLTPHVSLHSPGGSFVGLSKYT